MRSLILLSVLFCSHVYSASIEVTDLDSQWELFKVNFDRKFATAEEEATRKANFAKSLEFIESHNNQYIKGDIAHEVAVNQFSDWSEAEYASYLSPIVMKNATAFEAIVDDPNPSAVYDLPATFDWRSQNGVTGIKNQGQCGACWAFATTSVVEAAYKIHKSQTLSLSEQNLVDCEKQDQGCNGGNAAEALAYVKATGLESESEYPFTGRNGQCSNVATKSHTKISGYHQLSNAQDTAIMTAIQANGPLVITIDASGNDFAQYKSGIISSGGKTLNHQLTVVGWGTNYWIVKNSWGTAWGQSGYGQIARGNNVRGINSLLFYPSL